MEFARASHRRACFPVYAAVLSFSIASGSRAQAQTLEVLTETRQVPVATISFAAGGHLATDYSQFTAPGTESISFGLSRALPTFQAAVQYPLTRVVVAEGEISHSQHGRNHSWSRAVGPGTAGGACQRVCPGMATTQLNESAVATGIGANLLFKTGGPRLSVFGGGGVALDWVSGELNVSRTCREALPDGCADAPPIESRQSSLNLSPRLLATYGVEVALNPKVTTFASFRWTGLGRAEHDSNDFGGTTLNGGVRVALTTRTAGPASREIRVKRWTGPGLRGTLIVLTDDEVIVRDEQGVHQVPLSEVRLVEKMPPPRITGRLVGLAVASAMWMQVAVTRDSCGDCQDGAIAAKFLSAMSIGAGAAIDAAVNAFARSKNVLYRGQANRASARR